ncbi:MAG: 30S ribosomal protein S17e [Candidatus Syntropharchaeales archaeon]|nr:30S ribosomal protein S17e [Candidatus Syntrophoarchaeum sp.]
MGNVRPTYIKVVGDKLRKDSGVTFTGDFEENKKIVEARTNVKSKTIRNRIAGYITSKINSKIRRESRLRGSDDDEFYV